jgi:hypothetical protein
MLARRVIGVDPPRMTFARLACVLVVGAIVATGCKGGGSDAPAPPAPHAPSSIAWSASASASNDVDAPHVAPDALAVCKDASDPLSALCALGADPEKARFECAEPKVSARCGAFDQWSCSYAGADAGPMPPVTFGASFNHFKKSNEMVDPRPERRTGPVRAVEVSTAVKDDAEGNAQVDALRATITKWGCVLRSGDVTARFDCGTWEAKVHHSDLVHRVIVDAAMKGFGDCGGA